MPTPSVNAQPNLGNYLGTNITGGVSPTLTGNYQADQNAANQANTQRYNLGLQNLIQGYNTAGGSIQQAIAASQNYGQSAQQKLNLQLQQQQGALNQSAVSRGLNNTTIQGTMQDLAQRQYNDASLQNNEQIANRQTGLLMNQANQQTQGANSISSYIASKNDQAPNTQLYAQLAQQAASNPGHRNVTTTTGNPNPNLSDFSGGGGAGGAGTRGGYSNPNTSNNGGYQSFGGGSGGGFGTNPLYYGGPTSTIPTAGAGGAGAGYSGGNVAGNSQAVNSVPDSSSINSSMANSFQGMLGPGPTSNVSAGMPIQAAQQPASISTAMQPASQAAPAAATPQQWPQWMTSIMGMS